MSEVDPLFERVRYYVEPDYEITNPDAEATPQQLREFFDRCIGLHSPAELDASYLEMRESLREGFGDEVDEAIVYMTELNSADSYRIFGTYVDLDTHEPVSRPEKTVVLRTHKLVESPLGPILTMSRSRRYEVQFNTEEELLLEDFEEESRIIDKAKLKTIRQIFEKALGQEMPKPKIETLEERIQRLSEEHQTFTQGRWMEAILLLDMIALLKELGLTDTDELNW